jgi:hypothetical protein
MSAQAKEASHLVARSGVCFCDVCWPIAISCGAWNLRREDQKPFPKHEVMPDDPKTPIDWQKYSWLATPAAIGVLYAALLFGPRNLLRIDPPTPASPKTPVTIEEPPPPPPVVFTTDDTDVLKDGKKLAPADALAIIQACNRGDAEYTVRYSPIGKDEVYRKVVVSGGTAPRPPPAKPVTPVKPDVPLDPNTKVTAVTYVYEKDQNGIPNHVSTALNKINRESNYAIVATIFEDDSTNGPGSVPAQYKAAYEAAKKEGLPVVVVTAGDKVLRSVKAPKTEAEILEAAK